MNPFVTEESTDSFDNHQSYIKMNSQRIPLTTAVDTLLQALESILLDDSHSINISTIGCSLKADNSYDSKSVSTSSSVNSRKSSSVEALPRSFSSRSDLSDQRLWNDDTRQSLKRSRADVFKESRKCQRTSLNLSSKFAKSLTMQDTADMIRNDSHCSNWSESSCSSGTCVQKELQEEPVKMPHPLLRREASVDMHATIEELSNAAVDHLNFYAFQNKLNPSQYIQHWNQKKRELEYNLMLIQQEGLADSNYDDVKSLTSKIMETAEWLAKGHESNWIREQIAVWTLMEQRLEILIKYIQQVESMTQTLHCSITTAEDEPYDSCLMRLISMFDTKKQVFGSLLREDGAEWSKLGLPCNKELIDQVRTWFNGLIWTSLVRVEYELNQLPQNISLADPHLCQLMKVVLSTLQFGAQVIEYSRSGASHRIVSLAFTLSSSFVHYCCLQLDSLEKSSRKHNARVMHLVDELVKVVNFLCILKGNEEYELDDHSMDLFSQQMVEVGLHLSSIVAKASKSLTGGGPTSLMLNQICKLVGYLSKLAGRSFEDRSRLKRLINRIPVGTGLSEILS